jgi:hypothetical protein
MKKIIKITENTLYQIIKRVINEQNEDIRQGGNNDPYQYKKIGNSFYFAKKGSNSWTLAKNPNAINAIKTKIFVDKEKQKNTDYGVIDRGTQKLTTDTFSPYSRDTLSSKFKPFLKSFDESVQIIGKVSKKIYNQLVNLQKNKKYINDSFIIINKDSAVAALFGPNYKFITKSAIATGKTKDIEDQSPLSHEEWGNLSIKWFKEAKPSSEKGKKEHNKIGEWIKNNPDLVNSDGSINFVKLQANRLAGKAKEKITDKQSSTTDFPYSYESLTFYKKDITPSGVFGLKTSRGIKSNYTGGADIINTFPLVNLSNSKNLVSAIHVYANTNRIDLANKAAKEDIETFKNYTRAGAGCVNVDKNFIINILNYDPKYVIILPDSGKELDIKVIDSETWSYKLIDIGEKCLKSIYDLF